MNRKPINNYITRNLMTTDPGAMGLNIEEFFSYVHKEEEAISEHQYVTDADGKETYEETWVRGRGLDALRAELWRFYYEKFFFEVKPSKIDPFMDFHLYQSQNKADFVAFVRDSPNYLYINYIGDTPTLRALSLYKKKATDWAAKKMKLLKSAPVKRELSTEGKIRAMRGGAEVSIWEVESFFMERWARPKKYGAKVHILDKEQVKAFVHAYFHGSPYLVTKKRIKSNGTQKDILKAVYEFFLTIDTDNTGTYEYRYMLIDAFEEFGNYYDPKKKNHAVEDFDSNFARWRKELLEELQVKEKAKV